VKLSPLRGERPRAVVRVQQRAEARAVAVDEVRRAVAVHVAERDARRADLGRVTQHDRRLEGPVAVAAQRRQVGHGQARDHQVERAVAVEVGRLHRVAAPRGRARHGTGERPVARALEEQHPAAHVVDHDEVEHRVAVEVLREEAEQARLGVARGVQRGRRLERAVAVAEQHLQAVRKHTRHAVEHGHGEIELAVAVEVTARDAERTATADLLRREQRRRLGEARAARIRHGAGERLLVGVEREAAVRAQRQRAEAGLRQAERRERLLVRVGVVAQHPRRRHVEHLIGAQRVTVAGGGGCAVAWTWAPRR
jgi:hypothetical protein